MGSDEERSHLWRQVEPQVTHTLHGVFHQQGHLVGQANLDLIRQRRGLAEVDQVFERERQGYRLAQLNLNVFLRLINILVAAQSHGAIANVASACKLYAVLGRIDGNCGEGKVSMSVKHRSIVGFFPLPLF